MYSLKSYSEQCYNIGSPRPSPARDPFQELPASKGSDFEFSPSPKKAPPKLAVKIKKPTKRKLDISTDSIADESEVSPKKAKIMNKKDKEEFMAFLAEQSRINTENITKSLNQTLETKIGVIENQIKTISTETKTEIKNIGNQLNEIRDTTKAELANIREEFGLLKTTVTETAANNLEELKDTLVPLVKDEAVKEVKNEMKQEFKAIDAIWKSSLADKVWEAEHNLLVFNYNVSKAPIDDCKDFLEKEMEIKADILTNLHIKRATRLGKGKNNQPPPLMLQFSHPSDRNTVLSHSKNLKNKPFKIEKDVPKLYRKAHSEFKEEAWKLREQFGYQTNITFSGHLMMLQFKDRNSEGEKFHYTIHKEYFPPPHESLTAQKNTLPVPPGTRATPPISPTARAKAECSVFMSGMKTPITTDLLRSKLDDVLSAEHKSFITDVQLKKPSLAIIFCNTWDNCKTIATSYKQFNGEPVTFKMFTSTKPKD